MMGKFKVYGNRTPEITKLEAENRLLAKEVAKEGFVLLENDGTLPLKNKKIALYGAGARLTVKGGTGSGDVHERYSVTIEEGLKNNGCEILSDKWLDKFSLSYARKKQEFHDMVEENIKGYPVWKVMKMFQKIGEYKMAYPLGDQITNEDICDLTDTCIYVIARQAGEGDDRKSEPGDYLLADVEIKNLKVCRANYKNLIVIINCGASLDISPLKEIGVNALIYYGQAGEEGGNALAEILLGKANPSGRLTDTWANSYGDYPTAKIAHPERLEENYEEGIYVGYRWFDASGIRPLYAFGYGLSYTTFEHKVKEVHIEDSTVKISVVVQNTGKMAGKQTLFSFLSKPNKKYYGETKSLSAFAKTKLLDAGEEDVVYLAFDIRDFATYDEDASRYVLESGSYGVLLGINSCDCNAVASILIENDTVVEECKACCKKQKDFKDCVFATPEQSYEGLPVLKPKAINTKRNEYDYALPAVSPIVKRHLNSLSDKELAMLCMGGGYFARQYLKSLGACGNTTSRLLKKGIPNILMSDGPAGINLAEGSAYTKRGGIKYVGGIPEAWQWGWLKSAVPKAKFLFAKPKHLHAYQYCTAWPNATTIAQTFNTELAEAVGKGVGKEMLRMGITLWLAPALNIHKDVLCGRNFEYYSEDPVVSGIFAAAITRGVQSNGGVGVTVKHFACNNRENDRTEVSSNLSERALREIYLKGFRIVCKEQPMAVMSSYNKLNGVYTADNRELLIDILRCEWGYQGLVMSDWDGTDRSDYASTIKNGNNMIMPGRKDIYKKLCTDIKAGRLTREDMMYSASYALNMIFEAKTTKDFLEDVK